MMSRANSLPPEEIERRRWRHPSEAIVDGTQCELMLLDSLGPYFAHGTYFLHDDGYWYRIEDPMRLERKVYRWRPSE